MAAPPAPLARARNTGDPPSVDRSVAAVSVRGSTGRSLGIRIAVLPGAAESVLHADHAQARTPPERSQVGHASTTAGCAQHASECGSAGGCECGACAATAGIVADPIAWSAPPAGRDLLKPDRPPGRFPVLGVPTPPPEIC